MLLITEKRIRGVICHTIHIYGEASNKYMKNYDKNKESYLMGLMQTICMDGQSLQKFPVGGFKWGKKYAKV